MTSFRQIMTMSLIAVVSTMATAQQYSPRDRERGYDRGSARPADYLRMNADRTHQMIQREADGLTMDQIRLVTQKLNDINSIIRSQYPPVPPPPPPMPPAPRSVVFKGKFETVEYTFEVRDLYELHTQCTAFVKTRAVGSVDDIDVSVNFGSIQRLRNSSNFWRTPYEICSQLTPVARSAGLTSPRGMSIVIGMIESVDFEFFGYSRSEISNQCEALVNRSPSLSSVDDIKMSVNFEAQKVLRNSSSFWRGAFEICNQVLQNL